MLRFTALLFFSLSLLLVSCEKCKRCRYTHEVTTIEQTPNGEVENTQTIEGILTDENGEAFAEECIKSDESFTIEQYYQNKKDTTQLTNFDYTCEDF